MNSAAAPKFLYDDALRLLFFGGKGGVGKTTCACAAALHLAQSHPDRSFLLVSTDPAHSLVDCFSGSIPPVNLTIKEIDPQACLARFKELHEDHLRTIATRGTFLDQSDITKLVDLSMPGLDETMALLEIVAWVKEDRYACIVVDTAPAGHTLKLLELPLLMTRWLAALDTMLAKYRYMARLYRGSYIPDAVDLYLQESAADLLSLKSLLSSPKRCRFVPVMLAEELSIHITKTLVRDLDRLGLTVQDIIVNRLLPVDETCSDCLDWADRQALAMAHLTAVFEKYSLWGLPLFYEEVTGTERLMKVWAMCRSLVHPTLVTPGVTPAGSVAVSLSVSHPSALPSSSVKLLLFAGKGGVGKTTLACASALRLAAEYKGKEVLLFSIDPAHSLAACLGCEIGPHEMRLAPGISAIELNAQAEYECLKQAYAAELKGAFKRDSGQSGMDLAFDREVMERMLDVAPVGLDEILAITRIVDLMEHNRYDYFVLDTAPTGHLLRFLEMPELIDQWLKTFFSLFLKYRNIFWFENITNTMVILSKRVKSLRRMLIDAQQAALVAVTIPTEMAYSETIDLLSACDRMGIAVPILFINLVTPPSDCPIFSLISRTQVPVLKKYETACVGRHVTHVYRQIEPHGFHRLSELGRSLYVNRNARTTHTMTGEIK